MASFNPYNNPQDSNCSFLITGQNCYKYYRMTDNNNLKVRHESISKKESQLYTNNYTCHVFVGGNLVVCSDAGDIFFFDSNGDFKIRLMDSPGNNFYISNIKPVKE